LINSSSLDVDTPKTSTHSFTFSTPQGVLFGLCYTRWESQIIGDQEADTEVSRSASFHERQESIGLLEVHLPHYTCVLSAQPIWDKSSVIYRSLSQIPMVCSFFKYINAILLWFEFYHQGNVDDGILAQIFHSCMERIEDQSKQMITATLQPKFNLFAMKAKINVARVPLNLLLHDLSIQVTCLRIA